MDIYKLLRQDLQRKIKKKKIYGSDCNLLSQQIYDKTQRQLSSSTLKRFFGLIKTNFKPSNYTLDTLALYVGYKDWNDFVNCYNDSKQKASESDSWDLLKNRIKLITDNSLESLKQKTNFNDKDFLFRHFAKKRFEEFEKNKKPATMFIAPDGYGKSSLMIQLVEEYILNSNASHKHDIVCLIDGSIFFNIYSENSNMDLLNQLIEFKIHSSLNFYYKRHPEKRKGRMWVFIDNIDEVFFDKQRYHHLVENLMQIIMVNNGGWFKLILTCRPENLEIFTSIIQKNPTLESYWYGVEFFTEKYIDAINIPLFSSSEIESIFKLRNIEDKFKYLVSSKSNVLEIITHPFSLSLFIGELSQNENITEIILLNRYILTRILSPPFFEEKQLLVNRYITLCNRGKEIISVEKDQLLNGSGLVLAYKQLISDGIIYEYLIPENSIGLRIFVSFNQEIVFDYMVLRDWSKDRSYSVELFFEILAFYCENKQRQCNLLRLFVKYIMHHKQFEVVSQIHDKFRQLMLAQENSSNVTECMQVMTSEVKDMLANHKELQNIFKF